MPWEDEPMAESVRRLQWHGRAERGILALRVFWLWQFGVVSLFPSERCEVNKACDDGDQTAACFRSAGPILEVIFEF